MTHHTWLLADLVWSRKDLLDQSTKDQSLKDGDGDILRVKILSLPSTSLETSFPLQNANVIMHRAVAIYRALSTESITQPVTPELQPSRHMVWINKAQSAN